ncbi:MAG: SLC13 family permease [Blastocatellales bacterium]
MFDHLFTIDVFRIVMTVLILMAAVYGFISEKLPPDLTALLALLGLLLTGVLTPAEAFSGFSHPATISVAAILVLSAGIERTGALSFVARRLLAPLVHNELLFTIVIMLVIGFISAFINNTAAVAIFIPIVLEVCRRAKLSPGKILMPMSHVATFGGMCTLIGTSTNLVTHEYAVSQGLPGFTMFELGKVGVPMLIGGMAYILLIGRNFLPSGKTEKLEVIEASGNYLAEFLIRPWSPWIGRAIDSGQIARDFDVELVEVVRGSRSVDFDAASEQFLSGDSVRVRGPIDQVLKLTTIEGFQLHRPEEQLSGGSGAAAVPVESGNQMLPLAEVVVLSTSGLIGRTIKGARFFERYDAVVLALRRRGPARGRPSTTPLQAGDVLVVEARPETLQMLAEMPGFLVIGTPPRPEERPGRNVVITLITLIGVIATVSFGLLPIVTAAVAGCAVLMLTGSLRPRQAYQAVDLSIIFLLAGSLALGSALEKTGITDALARGVSLLGGVASPFVVLAGFFLAAVIVSEFMSNSGTVPLLAPIALSVAGAMELNPMALLAAVNFGASAAFAMPIGYQTSLMIYGPGNYTFRDFVRMGLVLDLLLGIIALLLIPKFWPLSAH